MLLFHSDRPGGEGGHDLWICTWHSPEAPFEEAVNLGPTVNSGNRDGGPQLSTDGLSLLFASDRPAGHGGSDLWMCTRAPPLAVAPFDAEQAKKHQQAWADFLGVPVEITNSIGMKLVLIPPGEFLMGSTEEEVAQLLEDAKRQNASGGYIWAIASEAPKHRVKITKAFYLGACEVTQQQYEQVTASNLSRFEGDSSRPADMVIWQEAVEFCRKLGELAEEKAAGAVYSLRTEAEWEYACRVGTTTRYSFGDDPAALGDYAWWAPNSADATHPVCGKKPTVAQRVHQQVQHHASGLVRDVLGD